MRHATIPTIHPRAWASLSAGVAALALAGTLAGVTRRNARQLDTLDPRAPFDPYYDLAEYALNSEPAP